MLLLLLQLPHLSTPAPSSKPGQAVGFSPVHHQSPLEPTSSSSAADCWAVLRFRLGRMFKLHIQQQLQGFVSIAILSARCNSLDGISYTRFASIWRAR